MGVKLFAKDGFRNGPLEPMQTRSRGTIRAIAEDGERIGYPDMAHDVLTMFINSEMNRSQLYGENLLGVAMWMKAARIKTADIPFLLPAFSEINMGDVRAAVIEHGIPHKSAQVGFAVAGLMSDALQAIDLRRQK